MKWKVKKSQLNGAITVPPSKSHSIRAILIATLADGKSVIHNVLGTGDGASALGAAEALGAIGSHDVVPALLKALTGDKDSSVRSSAAYALGTLGSRDAMPALLKALTSDKESLARGRAIDALGAIGDDTVTPSLLKALEDEGISFFVIEYHKKLYILKVKDKAFEALYKISRRLGVRFAPEDGRQKTEDR